MLITVILINSRWTLSSITSIQPTQLHIIPLRFILILSSPLSSGLPSGVFSLWFPTDMHIFSSVLCVLHTQFHHLNHIGEEYKLWSSSFSDFLHPFVAFSLSTLFSNTLIPCSSLGWETNFHIHT